MISDSDAIKAAVDRLTKPTTETVVLDDGRRIHPKVPSLWDQACIVGASGASGRSGSGGDRSPIDLHLAAVRELIARTTTTALRQRGLTPARSVPLALRQLAAHVITWETVDVPWLPGDGHPVIGLRWWAYRFASWADLLESMLLIGQRRVPPTRLRNSRCPECGYAQVITETEDGDDRVLPALAVEFHDGYVRAIVCEACWATWWRGDLHVLAAALGLAPLAAVS